MQYFVSKLQFSINIANTQLNDQYEELTILIQAGNKQEAYEKALEIGEKNEDEFQNVNQNTVYWKFEGITHLFQLPTLDSGTVVFSELRDDYTPEQRIGISQRIHKLQKDIKNTMTLSQ